MDARFWANIIFLGILFSFGKQILIFIRKFSWKILLPIGILPWVLFEYLEVYQGGVSGALIPVLAGASGLLIMTAVIQIYSKGNNLPPNYMYEPSPKLNKELLLKLDWKRWLVLITMILYFCYLAYLGFTQ